MPPPSVFRLLLFVLPPAACAATVHFLMADSAGEWTMRGLLPSPSGPEFVVLRILPSFVLTSLALFHLAVVLPVAWLTFQAGEGRAGARFGAATLVIGAATLAAATILQTPGSPLWATLLMAALYGGVPAAVLWAMTVTLSRFALPR